MAQLTVHGNEITSIFQLLGDNENDITYSTGWVLSKCNKFLELILLEVMEKKIDCDNSIIRLQEYKEEDKGYTDIEIFIEKELFFIIEAKRGWALPTKEQLMRYLPRFNEYPVKEKKLVVISECETKFAMKELNEYNVSIEISFIEWKIILDIIEKIYSKVSNYEKKLLNELLIYLKGVITIQDKKSNMAYCVVLSEDLVEGSNLSYIDVVKKKNKYFYPMKPGWPEPPNYMAFRYYGKLQSIHHVESYKIVEQLHDSIPEIDPDPDEILHYVLELGPAFKPEKEVRNGRIYSNGRLWCMLDTLLTCDTIKEARDLTKKRLGNE